MRAIRGIPWLTSGAWRPSRSAALAIEPRSVKALLRRGLARSVLGDYEAALTDFEQVLVLEPNNRDAQNEINRMRRLAGA